MCKEKASSSLLCWRSVILYGYVTGSVWFLDSTYQTHLELLSQYLSLWHAGLWFKTH